MGMRTPTILPLLLLSAAAVATADVKYVNYTIDDQNGDQLSGRLVEYSPPGYWSQGNGCDHCAFHPNNQSAFNDTWHDGFRVPSRDFEPLAFQFKFNGTAFYIFNILVRLTLTDVNITLDGTLVGSYTRFANVSEQEQFLYNVPIFAHDYIPYGEHTVGVSAFGPYQTNVLFDYAVYTTNVTADDTGSNSNSNSNSSASTTSGSGASSTSSSPHKSAPAGAIAGGVVGGVILLGALTLFAWWRRRRHAQTLRRESVTPYVAVVPRGDALAPPEEKGADGAQTYAPPVLPSSNLNQQHPLTPTAIVAPLSPSDDAPSNDAFRASVQALREQVAAARASQLSPISGSGASTLLSPSPSSFPSTSPPPSFPSEKAPSTSGASSGEQLQDELRTLRLELEELRAQRTRRASAELMLQELASLRAEMDEMRMQQDIARGPLPSYSPPARPLPGFGGAGV